MRTMKNATLKNAGEYIKNHESFRASNLWAIEHDDGGYIVYSYATVIYMLSADGNEIINRLEEKFSRSTSRHQSIIKKSLNIK